jgi:hypothetical protein
MSIKLNVLDILNDAINKPEEELDLEWAWPPIQPAAPTVIKPAESKTKAKSKGDNRLIFFVPDPQIGYRKYEDGTLDPFHDEVAIDIQFQILAYLEKAYGVDEIIHLGDYLDLPTMGKYAQEEMFAHTVQPAINYGHNLLAKQRATCPTAKIVLLEGNHDCRMQKYVVMNAMASKGIKRANAVPEDWPVMSLPHLLRLEDLNVDYVGAYPAGEYWLTKNLKAIHGTTVRSGGSTASSYVNANPHISTVFGHAHRQELQYKTVADKDGPIRSVSASPGCLCRVDGAVPSYGGGVNDQGRPVTHWENWQQGVMVGWIRPDGQFTLQPIHIMSGWALYEGQEFTSSL